MGRIAIALIIANALIASPAIAQDRPPSLRDSFPIGSGGGVLCQAQSRAIDAGLATIFDRAWSIVCRDVAQPVGTVYALRNATDTDARIIRARATPLTCTAGTAATIEDVGAVASQRCRDGSGTEYVVHRAKKGRTTFYAQGLGGYDSALTLALRTVVTDRPVAGAVAIATTGGSGDFARTQAGAFDPGAALAEGYRRNNSGNYAEAAQFFDILRDSVNAPDQTRVTADAKAARLHEAAINRALQSSNLGEFDQADALFAQARAMESRDLVQRRLLRNFEAIDKLNRRDLGGALLKLDSPVPPIDSALIRGRAIDIGEGIAAGINSGAGRSTLLGEVALTPAERAMILDAQAGQLRGTIIRLQGDPVAARAAIERAYEDAVAVREGRVTSITRLRAQMLGEIALAYEAERNLPEAERKFSEALALLLAEYPETSATNGARARLGAYLLRHDRGDDALTIYREIVRSTIETKSGITGFASQFEPYFDYLVASLAARPELAGDMVLASQLLVRPGAADTFSVLSRQLSAGNAEASRLFRQSLSLSRDVERARIRLAQILNSGNGETTEFEGQRAALAALSEEQARTQAALAAYPQYRAIGRDTVSIDELRDLLKPGEAYSKLVHVGDALFALHVDEAGATGYRLPLTARELASKVASLRATISAPVDGVETTFPFDVVLARGLYLDLFGPVTARIERTTALVFEPDSAMLQLPPNLLVIGQAGVDAYVKQTANPEADAFDFRAIQWLGRDRTISTALSLASFRDARGSTASAGARSYLGMGSNAPVGRILPAAFVQGPTGTEDAACVWPSAEWNKPIAASELVTTRALLGTASAELLTGAAFSDTAVAKRSDLADFRILHFATHGLVTPPRPGCPARPALLTSFGDEGSDGLLGFAEIFDLRLDADLVILSACDTASRASVSETRAAGITSGGGTALDGLVRAFIGAGSRAVIASHWPAPDAYNATERLITGMFREGAGQPIGEGLRRAQIRLMEDAETSHPFYWAGFAIVGDGARTVTAAR